MEFVPIAKLRIAQPGRETKGLKATVVLIWPYSSMTHQYALLLADSDVRARRGGYPVRVCFTGEVGKAMALQRIQIGDEVILGLKGFEFVKTEGAIPGGCTDEELLYSSTVACRVLRNCVEVANLEIDADSTYPQQRSPQEAVLASPTWSAQRSPVEFTKEEQVTEKPSFRDQCSTRGNCDAGCSAKRQRNAYGYRRTWSFCPKAPSLEHIHEIEDDPELDLLSPLTSSNALSS